MLKTFVKLITRVMKFLRIFPEFFSRKVGSLGERVGTYPRSFASISFLLALFLATGLQRIKFITDMELLFVPTNSPGITVCKKIVAFLKDLFLLLISIAKREKNFQERENVESLFSLKYERNYFQGHETRYLSQLVVIIKAKNPDQDGLFKHNGLLELAKKIDDTVHETRVRSGLHGNIQFKDVCALTRMSEGRECQKNEFIELSPRMDKIRSGKVNLTFPQFEDPVTETSYFMPAHFGNITTTLINDDSRYVRKKSSVLHLLCIIGFDL